MKVAIASDHAGYLEKNAVKEMLVAAGHEVTDFGTDSSKSVDYPDFALAACKSVVEGKAERAILICGTGIGMSIAANKVRGVRCALVSDLFGAEYCRLHNNANVLAMGARTTDIEKMKAIATVFLSSPFEGGRHTGRLDKIAQIEEQNKDR